MGKQWKQCQTLFFLWGGGSKITANGDCSHEIKKHILLKRKVMTNLDSILEKEMATHSSILGLPSWLMAHGSWLSGEGNGTPLQYSCMENPMGGGA